ncbi:cytochrome c oxidase cbb3-type subunit 3 [Salinihabitans flavidus]|uniref:Cbb3-type cytochrome c oxidase subunit n=1 Tax=Salinihabitans flavidus TaxID=569882 RepID=A0A1H8W6U6_9RHOB|nr:cytochrome-c oxidase, cbb3-type subunit III [Salinihabitans flavidus]SEP23329.1 cytochrome c oxidase cbb3-type subunit 3 [Salinihabitans flavidus]
MSTDPKTLPGADPHTGNREIDPVTGYDTTGHDWGGIKELNTPFPKVALVALVLTVIYSVIAWILLPAWPLGREYTRGILGLDQQEMAERRLRDLVALREDWLGRFENPDFTALSEDADLMAIAMPAADRLYQDNCSACHGRAGSGGPGYPVLHDTYWLWGGAPEDIAMTLQVGINAAHPDTRWAQMPAFDWMEDDELSKLSDYVAAMPSGEADPDSEASTLFAENCVACHSEGGAGGLMNGAPSLVDDAVIYGQDTESVMATLRNGRQGVMPYWSERVSDAEINALSLYVSRLPDDGAADGAETVQASDESPAEATQ